MHSWCVKFCPHSSPSSRRAWIEILRWRSRQNVKPSPSSRRAWIEMQSMKQTPRWCGVALLAEGVDRNVLHDANSLTEVIVALLAEGVDRNTGQVHYSLSLHPSPSSRRAWIEISYTAAIAGGYPVALLAEGVDRNAAIYKHGQARKSRPPRGGRG